MANYATLRADIAAAIQPNGNEDITGQVLQDVLLEMVDALVGYTLLGVAVPSLNPGTPDEDVAYLAGPGTYPHFGGAVVPEGCVGLLLWSGTWAVRFCPADSVRGIVSQTQTWSGGSTGYTYVMSDQVWGYIPRSFIDLAKECGATFNAATGYFEMNGLTDVSYDEMRKIERHKASADIAARVAGQIFRYFDVRTFTKGRNGASLSWNNVAYRSEFLEVLDIDTSLSVSSINSAFAYCFRLKQIGNLTDGPLSFTGTAAPTTPFLNCYSLVTLALSGIKVSVSIANSPNLSPASVAYMINNVGVTTPITITLHATAYAAATADADVTAALAAHTNVSLASA